MLLKAWRTACKDAGLPGRYLHDMRRSAVRNLERAGVPRSTAMALVAESILLFFITRNRLMLHAFIWGRPRAQ